MRTNLGANFSYPRRVSMQRFPVSVMAVHGFICVTLLLLVGFCHGNDKSVEVVGIGECTDCSRNSHAFEGFKVAIDCKAADGSVKTRGLGKLDEAGKFRVALLPEMVEDGHLKDECFVKLHGVSLGTSCPLHIHNGGDEASKIIKKSEDNTKHTFGTTEKLSFSATCASVLLKRSLSVRLRRPPRNSPRLYKPPNYNPIVYTPSPRVVYIPIGNKPAPHYPNPPLWHP